MVELVAERLIAERTIKPARAEEIVAEMLEQVSADDKIAVFA